MGIRALPFAEATGGFGFAVIEYGSPTPSTKKSHTSLSVGIHSSAMSILLVLAAGVTVSCA